MHVPGTVTPQLIQVLGIVSLNSYQSQEYFPLTHTSPSYSYPLTHTNLRNSYLLTHLSPGNNVQCKNAVSPQHYQLRFDSFALHHHWNGNVEMVMKSLVTGCTTWQLLVQPMEDFITTFAFQWLTHWGQDKLAAIFQTTFSSMKMLEFWLEFHWSLFLRV